MEEDDPEEAHTRRAMLLEKVASLQKEKEVMEMAISG